MAFSHVNLHINFIFFTRSVLDGHSVEGRTLAKAEPPVGVEHRPYAMRRVQLAAHRFTV